MAVTCEIYYTAKLQNKSPQHLLELWKGFALLSLEADCRSLLGPGI